MNCRSRTYLAISSFLILSLPVFGGEVARPWGDSDEEDDHGEKSTEDRKEQKESNKSSLEMKETMLRKDKRRTQRAILLKVNKRLEAKKRQRRPDAWDRAYDTGKQKKVKSKPKDTGGSSRGTGKSSNPFQQVWNRKMKDKKKTKYKYSGNKPKNAWK